MINQRINNLELRESSYLFEKPEHPSWEICMWEPNLYYGNEDKFIKDGDYYRHPDETYSFFRIHKSCFKNPESCFTIASFVYDANENFYELHFCGDRPIRHYSNYNIEDFCKLIEYGNSVLNNNDDND